MIGWDRQKTRDKFHFESQNGGMHFFLQGFASGDTPEPVASKVLTPGSVGWEWLEKVVDSKRMTPATERDADESKDS